MTKVCSELDGCNDTLGMVDILYVCNPSLTVPAEEKGKLKLTQQLFLKFQVEAMAK